MIDKERGNIVKMDRHMYVKVAFHGNTLLDTKTRTETYGYESYAKKQIHAELFRGSNRAQSSDLQTCDADD